MTREAFEDYLHNRLDVVTDGAAGMAYLRKEPPYEDMPRPDLILLDLNLPRRDGRQVLQEIKDDPDLRHIPVIVLTTSQAEEDVLRSYQLHANAYVTKPVDFEGFIEAIKQIDHFFVSVAHPPPGERAGPRGPRDDRPHPGRGGGGRDPRRARHHRARRRHRRGHRRPRLR